MCFSFYNPTEQQPKQNKKKPKLLSLYINLYRGKRIPDDAVHIISITLFHYIKNIKKNTKKDAWFINHLKALLFPDDFVVVLYKNDVFFFHTITTINQKKTLSKLYRCRYRYLFFYLLQNIFSHKFMDSLWITITSFF